MSDASSVPMFDPELAQQLVERAKAEGVKLTGPGGLLGDLTKRVLEAGLEGEMDGHVGYAKHTVEGRNGANSRNGTRTKTVITDVGPVEIEVPRDRDGTFEPALVRKHQRRLGGVDDMVLSLSAKGLTTGEISAHLAEVYGASVSKDTVSRITDRVIDEAFLTWHPEAFALDGAKMAARLKARRDQLTEVAEVFFEHLNHEVDILGSTQDDRFDVWFGGDGSVRVAVRGKDPEPYFDRTFDPRETRELRLYALEGKDALVVHGTPRGSIDIRFVGGEGKDTVSSAAGQTSARDIRVYDSEDGATIDPAITVRDERSNQAHLNQYDRAENHEPNLLSFIPGLLINADDGFYLGGLVTLDVHGYKKSPFAARHTLAVHFATATLGATLDYHGLFPQSADLLDQQLDISLKSQTYTRNFFGYTNQVSDSGEAPTMKGCARGRPR